MYGGSRLSLEQKKTISCKKKNKNKKSQNI